MRKAGRVKRTKRNAIPALVVRINKDPATGNFACLIDARRNTAASGASIQVKLSELTEILGEAAIHARSTKSNSAEAIQIQMFGKTASTIVAENDEARLSASLGMVSSSKLMRAAMQSVNV
jgi:hypothetical protein